MSYITYLLRKKTSSTSYNLQLNLLDLLATQAHHETTQFRFFFSQGRSTHMLLQPFLKRRS